MIALIGNPDRWYLCMDRTNWKIGKSDVNILMLAVVTERYCSPPDTRFPFVAQSAMFGA